MIPPIVVHGGANQPPTVHIEAASPHAFVIGPLRRPTRWFREIGYTVPILSQDHDFDARWSVEADDHEFAQALVRERQARAAIAALAELGCVAFKHSRRRLSAILGRRPKGRQEREQHKQAVRDQLAALDAVVVRLCRSRSFPHNGGRLRLAIVAVLLSLALLAGLLGLALGGGELIDGELGTLVLKSLLVSGPLTVLLLAGLARLVSGRSTSHKDLGVVLLLAGLGMPVLGMGAAVTINRTCDDGTRTVRRLPVLELKERAGDHRVDHFAIVPGWRESGGSTQSIPIGKQMAAQAVPGRSWLRLTTSPGKLNAERLLDLQLESDGSDH